MVSPSYLSLFGEPSQSEVENDEEFINMDEELRNPGYVFPEITTESFVDYLLPPLKEGITVKSVRSSLSKKGLTGFDGQWKRPRALPGIKRRKKHDAFARLVDIFQKATSVVSAKAPYLEQMIDMIPLPTPERRKNCKRRLASQDACFVLKDRWEPTTSSCSEQHAFNSWDDIALTAGFQGSSSDEARQQNARKIISNIQLTMARDPCRRFSFGLTVENATMRLWFCSRSSPVVSKPFDFSKDLNTLIHIFLSLSFATKEELGWDPTVQPFIGCDGRRGYRIDVDGETYETSQVLSGSSADELTGHATRVWIARRPDSDVPYVLKDAWTEDDEMPEHSVYDTLLHDVEAKYDSDVRREVASHLLTPVSHCLVRVNGEEDDTTGVMMRGYTPSFKERYRVNVENLGSSSDDDDKERALSSTEIRIEGLERGVLRDPLYWYNPVRKVRRRRHYRVVFKEVAKPLNAVRELADVFTVLSDSAKTLKWIHGAGWVHRDLSAGNLYLYQGRGLIGDLEYAKPKNSDLENELCIGTSDFMAVEALDRNYAHIPEISEDEFQAGFDALHEGRLDYVQKIMDSRVPPPFFHNDFHDLESLWWVAVWELFNNRVILPTGSACMLDKKQETQRKSIAAGLFPSNGSSINRTLFIRSVDDYYKQVAWMPGCLRSMKILLNSLRVELILSYRKFEAGFPCIETEICDSIHDKFQALFAKCRDSSNGMKIILYRGSFQRLENPDRDSTYQGQDARLSDNKETFRPKTEERAPTQYISKPTFRNGKRKRDDDAGTVASARPHQMARYEIEVF